MAKPFKNINRKPTSEELQKGMEDGLKELEKIENEENDPQPQTLETVVAVPVEELTDEQKALIKENADKLTDEQKETYKGILEDQEEEDDEENEDESKGDEGEEDEGNPPNQPIVPEPKKEEKKPDYQKRYSDSSTEAHILYSKNKKMTEAIEKAGEVPEPTEDELKVEYPEWDVMSDTEKKFAKRDLHNSRKLDAITQATKEFKDIDEWNKKVDGFLSDPATLADHPQLEGKEEDFKVFATTKLSRMGVDFEDLISSFLYAESQKPKPKKTGKMFENGSGGQNGRPTPKSDKISVADSRILRKTDYKKYLQLLKQGKIESDFE